MSYYGRHISGLWLSTTADYAENELSPAPTETFTATKFIEDLGRTVQAAYTGSPISYDLLSWTSITLIQIVNTGTGTLEVDWNTIATPYDAGGSGTYTYIAPGVTAIIPSALPVATVLGNAGSVVIWGADNLPGTFNVTILGT